MSPWFLGALLLLAAGAPGSTNAAAQLRKCVPDTLGSEWQRQHQVWAFEEGRITQPLRSGAALCLTASAASMVQPAPGPRGMAWGIGLQPCVGARRANQSWSLNPQGAIVLSSLGMCIDVAGYDSQPGAQLHLWRCTEPGAGPGGSCPPTVRGAAACQAANCTCTANQQWTWAADGNVVGRMSGLCLDAGSSGVPPQVCDGPANNGSQPLLPYCDRSLTPAERASKLVAAANLSERERGVSFTRCILTEICLCRACSCQATEGENAPAGIANLAVQDVGYPSLGVAGPAFGEALHGVVGQCGVASAPNSTGCATSFPHALALGCRLSYPKDPRLSCPHGRVRNLCR
jgi:hypothetical protein